MAHEDGPPMGPNTGEATVEQLDFAREQGESYGRALSYMIGTFAHDGGGRAGPEGRRGCRRVLIRA